MRRKTFPGSGERPHVFPLPFLISKYLSCMPWPARCQPVRPPAFFLGPAKVGGIHDQGIFPSIHLELQEKSINCFLRHSLFLLKGDDILRPLFCQERRIRTEKDDSLKYAMTPFQEGADPCGGGRQEHRRAFPAAHPYPHTKKAASPKPFFHPRLHK